MNRITVRATDGAERIFTLRGGNLTIGRDPDSGICLQDTQVSWQHAVLSEAGGTCFIEDLGSSNGTFVGAERIRRQVLKPGELVRIGSYELTLQKRPIPSATSASEHTMFDIPAYRAAKPVARRPDTQETSTQRKLRFTDFADSYRTANLRQEATRLDGRRADLPQGRPCAVGGLPTVMACTLDPDRERPMPRRSVASLRRTGDGDSLMMVLGLHDGDRGTVVHCSAARHA